MNWFFIRWPLVGFLLASPAFGHSKKLSQIDSYCRQVQTGFATAMPFVFSGPDPWVQMDELPAAMPDEALAFVYTVGPEVQWVFLRAVDLGNGWSEDVDYFFREDGTLAKRLRRVQSATANITLEVTTWYEHGRVLKERTRHHSLNRGRQDASKFNDPDAPVYWTTDDLPFPDIPDLRRRLA
jgi:hypothetical protein